MTLDFDLDLAKLAISLETGILVTKNGCFVEITEWHKKVDGLNLFVIEGYCYTPPGEKITSWDVMGHKRRFCEWSLEGNCINSLTDYFDLVIKPTIPL